MKRFMTMNEENKYKNEEISMRRFMTLNKEINMRIFV